jgi:ubiquinone/menaquinone biosynthesis C-methylase UbiE
MQLVNILRNKIRSNLISGRYVTLTKFTVYIYNVLNFIAFQYKLATVTASDRKQGDDPAYAFCPPARLRHRVSGSLDRETFIKVGKVIAQNIRDLCAMAGRNIYSFENILDFGSGSGRVIANFKDVPEACHFYGTDIDAEMVLWCEEHIPGVHWNTNGYTPPLAYLDNTFDLIYAISVFTHLDEDMQNAWLGELRRIAKPGAILILTVLGDGIIGKPSPNEQNKINSSGFAFVVGARGKLKIDNLPDFYQTTYHSEDYIRRVWSNYFEIVCYVPRGINNHQDAVILRKI